MRCAGGPNGVRTRVSTLRGCPGPISLTATKRRRAADLLFRVRVGLGRYPSSFDVMRDIRGITRAFDEAIVLTGTASHTSRVDPRPETIERDEGAIEMKRLMSSRKTSLSGWVMYGRIGVSGSTVWKTPSRSPPTYFAAPISVMRRVGRRPAGRLGVDHAERDLPKRDTVVQ